MTDRLVTLIANRSRRRKTYLVYDKGKLQLDEKKHHYSHFLLSKLHYRNLKISKRIIHSPYFPIGTTQRTELYVQFRRPT